MPGQHEVDLHTGCVYRTAVRIQGVSGSLVPSFLGPSLAGFSHFSFSPDFEHNTCRFISRQVGPMHDAIGQDVAITFVPYGFATVGS